MAKHKGPALTIIQACAAFGVTPVCLGAWRRGTATRKPLPSTVLKGGRGVLIPVDKAERWANAHGVNLARSFDDVLADAALQPKKPGPRPVQAD